MSHTQTLTLRNNALETLKAVLNLHSSVERAGEAFRRFGLACQALKLDDNGLIEQDHGTIEHEEFIHEDWISAG